MLLLHPLLSTCQKLADFLRPYSVILMAMNSIPSILVVNTGSSSIKFRLYSANDLSEELAIGKILFSGQHQYISIKSEGGEISREINITSVPAAAGLIIEWLKEMEQQYIVKAIGFRVVHGGTRYFKPETVTPVLISELKKIIPLAPLHLPDSITLLEIFGELYPHVLQVACFDTFFHRHLPFEAKHYALPRYLWKDAVLRFGFHGISCQSIMDQLLQLKISLIHKKIIIAHLGSGCSITAIRNNISIDNSMGMSPSGGLVMNTRPGDLDPGIFTYLQEQKKLSAADWNHLINVESGLKAIAGTTDPVGILIQKEKTDKNAAEAVKIFCYSIKKQIGAMAAAAGGLDILVFTGGIGENEPALRERICEGLEFLNIRVDKDLNERGTGEIAVYGSPVSVLVMPTNEELIIAKELFNRFIAHKKRYYEYSS